MTELKKLRSLINCLSSSNEKDALAILAHLWEDDLSKRTSDTFALDTRVRLFDSRRSLVTPESSWPDPLPVHELSSTECNT